MKKLAILVTIMFVAGFFMVSSAQAEGCCKAKQEQAQCPKAPAEGGCEKQCPKDGQKKECPKPAEGQGKCEKTENPQ